MKEQNVWSLYQGKKELREAVPWASGKLRFLSDMIPSGVRILDIGIGNGYLERLLLSRKDVEVYAADPSKESCEILITETGLEESHVVTAYSDNLPFADSFFDYVVMADVLEHLNDHQLQDTLKEVWRVLKDGGYFIGTVPADENLELSMVVCPRCGHIFHRWGHLQSFSKKRLQDLLSTIFEDVQVYRMHFPDYQRLNWKGKITAVIKQINAILDLQGSEQSFYFNAKKLTSN